MSTPQQPDRLPERDPNGGGALTGRAPASPDAARGAHHAPVARGIRSTIGGLIANTLLAAIKMTAGILGNSYALIADAVESTADVASSLIVWRGLHISARAADEDYPFGYGKAEPLAAAIVALMLLLAAVGIVVEAIREILTPHHAPAPFTLAVLVLVVLVKELLFRRVFRVGESLDSTAVKADAWHHRSDAITSLAAMIGITVALVGGPGWESADDWAAIAAALIIFYNGTRIMRPALADLMDRAPDPALLERVARAARAVDTVQAIEKLKVRKVGMGYYVDLHVQTDPAMSLHDAHIVSGRVKSAIRRAVPAVHGALIHMEPFEPAENAPPALQHDDRISGRGVR
ncbi:MAG TPA: cation diffusion facilitator family transporter [Gemmatimonadaceae bacterium]|nr:cation diffusion facilitator family transporter [Gemmatimonadaceae bacterium]